jgi:hypothetical protein
MCVFACEGNGWGEALLKKEKERKKKVFFELAPPIYTRTSKAQTNLEN